MIRKDVKKSAIHILIFTADLFKNSIWACSAWEKPVRERHGNKNEDIYLFSTGKSEGFNDEL